MRLFIVNDSDIITWRLLVMLHELGGVELVGRAVSARQAGEMVPALLPDAIILDLDLADGGALAVLEKIVKLRHRPLVITLCGEDAEPYRRQARRRGADYCFDKGDGFMGVYEVLDRSLSQSGPEDGRDHMQG